MKQVIADRNNYNKLFTEYVDTLRKRSTVDIKEFAEMRNMPVDEIMSSGIFYIGNMTEMLLPDYLGYINSFGIISETNGKPIFNNRWVIPIRNRDNQTINLVGYSKDAPERYIYGNARYYRRRDCLYGLENLELAYKLGYAFVTEGITDAIRIRSLGKEFQPTFARCGTHKSEFIVNQLNRLKYGTIFVPDRDFAGRKSEKDWKLDKMVTLYVPIMFKDCDEMLRNSENERLFKLCAEQALKDLKDGAYKNMQYVNKNYTMFR